MALDGSLAQPAHIDQPLLERLRQLASDLRGRLADPRGWQILSLTLLLAAGVLLLGFDQTPAHILAIVAAAIATQWACSRIAGLPAFDPTSALISALSLCLLLRAGSVGLLASAAVLAIASKFVIRFDGKHVFNPTNFAIVLMLLSGQAWISPAQWGSRTWFAFLFACLAGLVLTRARRADVALAFLGTFIAILIARALYLGDPLSIPLKQMQSGALLLFAFFMISDPKTTPDRRSMRVLFGVAVALLAAWLQLGLYKPEGLMYALFLLSPLVPLLDRLAPIDRAHRFQWSRPTA